MKNDLFKKQVRRLENNLIHEKLIN